MQGLDRYGYVNNAPLNYVDPTGHLTEKEICKYMGYCDRKSAEAGLGKNLFKLLWNTKITWGDTIILGTNKNGAAIHATLVLFANTEDGSLTGALWNIETGERVPWPLARDAEYSAAYNQQNDAWYSADKSGNDWCNRDSCTTWAGRIPTTHTAEDLFIDKRYEGYGLSNYYYLDGWAYAEALFGLATLSNPLNLPQKVALVMSLVFLAHGASDLAPKSVYPIVSFIDPHTAPPWYVPLFGFSQYP